MRIWFQSFVVLIKWKSRLIGEGNLYHGLACWLTHTLRIPNRNPLPQIVLFFLFFLITKYYNIIIRDCYHVELFQKLSWGRSIYFWPPLPSGQMGEKYPPSGQNFLITPPPRTYFLLISEYGAIIKIWSCLGGGCLGCDVWLVEGVSAPAISWFPPVNVRFCNTPQCSMWFCPPLHIIMVSHLW